MMMKKIIMSKLNFKINNFSQTNFKTNLFLKSKHRNIPKNMKSTITLSPSRSDKPPILTSSSILKVVLMRNKSEKQATLKGIRIS